jgi:hypothetical protein
VRRLRAHPCRCLLPGGDSQLAKNPLDVSPHPLHRDAQALGDVRIGCSARGPRGARGVVTRGRVIPTLDVSRIPGAFPDNALVRRVWRHPEDKVVVTLRSLGYPRL